ncbi:MAG: beta strand repeat-containing protein, partial [Micromonosporaceae bacterium]
ATTFTVNNPGTFTITTTGVPPVTAIVRGGAALPAGVTYVDNGDGTATLSGTPGAGTGGVYAMTFTINNGVGGNVVQNFTLTVAEPALITSAASTTFTAGTPGTFTVTTSGEPEPAITVTGTLPGGVTLVDNGDGTATLSGTPAPASGGTYALVLEATNGVGPVASQNFTLTVNEAPVFTSATSTTFTVGTPGTFTVTTLAFPAITTIARGGAALPAGISYVDNGDGTATLSGTAAPGTGGSHAITFTINNGVGGNVVQSFTLNVEEPPAITSAASDTFIVGTADSFTVTATGFPAPTVTHSSGALPGGVTFTSATRLLAGTATQTGAFPIQFTAANGVGSNAVQAFTLNVVCPAITVTPTAMPDGLFQTAYAPVDFNQTGSTGSTFTWGATGLPDGMSIDANTGVVSGTPDDTVLNAAVTITVSDNFNCQGVRNTTLTIRPVADNETYNGGVGHTQFVVASSGVATPHVLLNDNVKNGDSGPGVLSVTFPVASANGAVLEGATDGTFVYTPNLNFAGPSDSFVYTLIDGNGVTNTGIVTINLTGIMWYVNGSGGNGDGRSHNPFNTLASAATASGANSVVYVHTGAGTTPGDLVMDAGQTLFGQGAPFVLNGLTIGAGTPPTLSGTVTLANNALVRAVAFAPSGAALVGAGLTQPVTIDQVGVTGGTTGLSLTNVSGAVTVTNSAFSNTTGAEVLISQGTGNVGIGATIISSAGRSIDIQNRTGGTVSFTGAITDTGQGIFLNANTGSTINFTGGLSLTTGVNPGFTATNGGTVSVTGSANTIATTTGTALNVANTNIGASGLTFRSISSNGAANGIALNNTGAGALTVTGNSSGLCGGQVTASGATVTAPVSADCSGGALLSSVGAGVSLTNTGPVSLTRTRIANSGGDGISGSGVAGLTLASSLVENNGNAVGERGIDVVNLTGSGGITSSTIRGSSEHNLVINNTLGTLGPFTITGSQFASTSIVTGDDGILLLIDGSASITASVTQSAFTDNKGD